jgi:hypothetical protein
MHPSIWGPHVWKTLHHVALGFPDDASEETKLTYKQFFNLLGCVLPCAQCRATYEQHIAEMPPIDDYMSNSAELFKWTVAFHNMHNVTLEKSHHLSAEEAMAHLVPPKPKPCHGCKNVLMNKETS